MKFQTSLEHEFVERDLGCDHDIVLCLHGAPIDSGRGIRKLLWVL